MPVASSTATLDSVPQKDGSLWCTERHLDAGSVELARFYYLTPAGFDAAAAATVRIPSVNAQLIEAEAVANMDRDGAPTVVHQTAAQFAARFREEVRNASQSRACYLAWWLLRRIAAGQITDAQCQTAFGMTASAWTTFKTNNMTPRSNAWAAVIAAGGL